MGPILNLEHIFLLKHPSVLLNAFSPRTSVVLYHFGRVYSLDPPGNELIVSCRHGNSMFPRTVSSGASPFNRRDVRVGPTGVGAFGRLYVCLAFFFGGGDVGSSDTI